MFKLHQAFFQKLTLILFLTFYIFAHEPALSGQPADQYLNPTSLLALERDLGLSAEQAKTRVTQEQSLSKLANSIESAISNDFGGSWIEPDKLGNMSLVLAVTNPDLKTSIESAGAKAIVVANTYEQLNSALESLNDASKNSLPDSLASWYVDPKKNRLVIEYVGSKNSSTQPLENFIASSDINIDLVYFREIEQNPTHFRFIGGSEILDSSGFPYCSVGFNVLYGDSQRGFVTAGHCVFQLPQSIFTDRFTSGIDNIGQIFQFNYPFSDNALASYSDDAFTQPILLAWDPYYVETYSAGSDITVIGEQQALTGASICRSGYRTGYRCGTVNAFNVSVNYVDGLVFGLTRISACAGQGDSGGASITPSGHAQGMVSGGQLPIGQSTNCNVSQPVTYIEPWLSAKQDLNVTLSVFREIPRCEILGTC